jgi:hypothetical protein
MKFFNIEGRVISANNYKEAYKFWLSIVEKEDKSFHEYKKFYNIKTNEIKEDDSVRVQQEV